MIRIGYDQLVAHGAPHKLSAVMAGTVLGFAWQGYEIGLGEVVAIVMPDGDPDAGRPVLVPVHGSKFSEPEPPITPGQIMVILREYGLIGNRAQQAAEQIYGRLK